MTFATANISNLTPMSVELLIEAIQKLTAMPKNDQWIVIDPQGFAHVGTVEQVIHVLLEKHPLVSRKVEIGPFKWNGV